MADPFHSGRKPEHTQRKSGQETALAWCLPGRLSFSVAAATDHGFLCVSKRDPHYFEFGDGTPYFAIGENMVHGTLADYSRWMTKLEANGGNYGRLWIGYPAGLEVAPRGEYRLDIAWKFDKIIDLSEQHGIYQKICIDYIRYISARGERRKTFDPEDNAYSVSNGGPCRNMRDFFALAEVLNVQRRHCVIWRRAGVIAPMYWPGSCGTRLARPTRTRSAITPWWSIGTAKCAGI